MMDPDVPERSNDGAADELGPQLREAVERIAGQRAPEELTRRCLDDAHRIAPTSRRQARRRMVALTALTAAASVALAFFLWWSHQRPEREREIAEPPIPARAGPDAEELAFDWDNLPTHWAYQRAMRESPEAFEALVEEHARRWPGARTEPLTIRELQRLDEEEL